MRGHRQCWPVFIPWTGYATPRGCGAAWNLSRMRPSVPPTPAQQTRSRRCYANCSKTTRRQVCRRPICPKSPRRKKNHEPSSAVRLWPEMESVHPRHSRGSLVANARSRALLLARHLQTLPDIVVGAVSRPQSRRPDFYREMGDIFSVPMKVNYHWSSFKDLRSRWEALVASTLWRPVLLVDEAQEMLPEVLSELRLLSSTQLDSRSILTARRRPAPASPSTGRKTLYGSLQSLISFPESKRCPKSCRIIRPNRNVPAACCRWVSYSNTAPRLRPR